MLAEKFVVTVDELSLTYGRKQLALVYTIELFCGCTSLRPEATAPEEIRMISTPDLCNSAIWSTSADIRVTSSVPSRRVNTLLPTFTAIRVNSCFILTNDLKAQI